MPTLLFLGSNCLLDHGSGAALSVRHQLQCLTKRGWNCIAITSAVFDGPRRESPLDSLTLPKRSPSGRVGKLPLFEFNDNGVRHLIIQTHDSRRSHQLAADEAVIHAFMTQQMQMMRPNILYTYGGLLFEQALHRSAQRTGVPVAFYLANANYKGIDPLITPKVRITPSAGLAQLYQERFGLPVHSLGSSFIDTSTCIAQRPESARRYVTLVTPSPEKGLAIFLTLAKLAIEQLPNVRFLIVEGRWSKQRAGEALNINWAEYTNIDFLPQQKTMSTVYEQTKVLLVPSLWFEGFGRVIVEAHCNGIPVIASNQPGIASAMGSASTLLAPPERCTADFRYIPTAQEVAPWMHRLKALMTDPEIYAAAQAEARQAYSRHSPEALTDRLESLLLSSINAQPTQIQAG